VFVRVLQTCIDEHRRGASVELLFEILFGDPGSGHEQLLSMGPARSVNDQRPEAGGRGLGP
jgi:hypothetical protein